MKPNTTTASKNPLYYRLVALWVLCEGFLGGIIHGLKIPVSGIVVGSGAIVCICMIAFYIPTRGAILKATIIVAIFKMMLSPYSPPAAYFAVFFQGLAGQVILSRKYFRLTCIVFATLAMIESALQRILVLLIIYGEDFWSAVNGFISKTTGQREVTNYSLKLATAYTLLHAIVGLLLGYFTSRMIASAQHLKFDNVISEQGENSNQVIASRPRNKFSLLRLLLFTAWIFLVIMFISSFFEGGVNIMPAHQSLQILLRSFLIVLTWYFVFSPLVVHLMKRWLLKQQGKRAGDVQQVMSLLPQTKVLVMQSWRSTAGQPTFNRIKETFKRIIFYSIDV